MKWNWELPGWPHFRYNISPIAPLEKEFFQTAGGEMAVLRHLEEDQQKEFVIEMLCLEGLKSAEIEGEILHRESLQSSIKKHFGLRGGGATIPAREKGMGDLICRVYGTFKQPLTHEMLYQWHRLLFSGTWSEEELGRYRTHEEPMQIVAGRYDKFEVHFEAPPSKRVFEEMTRFIEWFNQTDESESTLVKAAIAHVYFESIHPFEDGNGRIGRALVEKILSQQLGYPTLLAVSQAIVRRKKEYYRELGNCNRTLDVQSWVEFFSQLILESQKSALILIHFLMFKSSIMNKLRGKINPRQEKVLIRMFAEGVDGFSGGLSAENYISITKTSRATASRDLAELVSLGALYKTGQLKNTRYWLNINP